MLGKSTHLQVIPQQSTQTLPVNQWTFLSRFCRIYNSLKISSTFYNLLPLDFFKSCFCVKWTLFILDNFVVYVCYVSLNFAKIWMINFVKRISGMDGKIFQKFMILNMDWESASVKDFVSTLQTDKNHMPCTDISSYCY